MHRSVFPPWRLIRLLGCAGLMLIMATSAWAQQQTGNIVGTVVDNTGTPMPGVTVTLTGGGAPRVFVTDSSGQFRFISLAPGQYVVRADLSGLGSAVRNNVEVNIGANTDLRLVLAPAVAQTITVTAETPLLDVRKTGTGATIAKVELEQVPSARDPWVVLQQVPGVLVDRINVGGNESGQQSSYVGKGSEGSQATWNYDGVNITDMAATGASPSYYDFDALEEMQATTGGSDPRIHTAGVNLNMVTKRGTNDLNGSGRFFMTDRQWQSDPTIPAEAESYLKQVNEINHIEDFGLEIGGPIIRDRLWLWGAYGEQNIELLAAAGLPELYRDNTFLTNYNLKLNSQIFRTLSGTLFLFEGSKEKFGRNVAPDRPPETAWNQGNLGGGPFNDGSWFTKLELTNIFSPNFYVTGLYSDVDMGFFLTPVGGRDPNTQVFRDPSAVWHNSFVHYESMRPMQVARIDASSFFGTGALNHELKYGFGYRETPTTSVSAWPGDTWGWDFGDGFALAFITRAGNANYETNYTDLYVGDTMLLGNWTIQAGLRYDKQTGRNNASSVGANTLFPDLLPGASFGGDERELEWTSISPRIGVTYSLGTARRTLFRAAYNQYADQLGSGDIAFGHPFAYAQGLYYYWEDANGDRKIQRPEIGDLYGWYGLDPDDPTAPISTVRLDYDMDVPKTNEIILGVEHELMPAFTVGINVTRRNKTNFTFNMAEKTRGGGNFYTPADYEVAGNATGTMPDGTTYSVPYYRLRSGVAAPTYYVTTNRPGYSRSYNGIELLATKRLSNRWMLRGNVSWNDWKQHLDNEWSPSGDPTPLLASYGCSTCDDEIVVAGSGTGSGAKGAVYINSRWSYNITGLVELPLGFIVSTAINGREGYPVPYYHRLSAGTGQTKNVLVEGVDARRLDNIMVVDMRLAKEFRIANAAGLTLSIDGFNVLDERTILQREHRLYSTATRANPAANRIREMVSPRVFRLGARVTF